MGWSWSGALAGLGRAGMQIGSEMNRRRTQEEFQARQLANWLELAKGKQRHRDAEYKQKLADMLTSPQHEMSIAEMKTQQLMDEVSYGEGQQAPYGMSVLDNLRLLNAGGRAEPGFMQYHFPKGPPPSEAEVEQQKEAKKKLPTLEEAISGLGSYKYDKYTVDGERVIDKYWDGLYLDAETEALLSDMGKMQDFKMSYGQAVSSGVPEEQALADALRGVIKSPDLYQMNPMGGSGELYFKLQRELYADESFKARNLQDAKDGQMPAKKVEENAIRAEAEAREIIPDPDEQDVINKYLP